MRKNSGFLKFNAAWLIGCFTFTTIAWSAPPLPAQAEVKLPSLADTLEIPKSLGTINERYTPSMSSSGLTGGSHHSQDSRLRGNDKIAYPTLIHIQDAHAHYEAQQNTKDILSHLHENYDVDLLFLEGGVDEINARLLEFFKDPKRDWDVADKLTKYGIVGGAELFLLETWLKKKETLQAFGVENPDIYKNNLEAYRSVLREEKKAEVFLQELKRKILKQSSLYFNKDLKAFFQKWMFYQDQPNELLRHLEHLNQYAQKKLKLNLTNPFEQMRWPQLVRFFKFKAFEEAFDPAKVEEEKRQLLRWMREQGVDKRILSFVIPAKAGISSDRSSTQTFEDDKTETFRGDTVRARLERFYAVASPKGFSFDQYPNFKKYAGAMILQNEIDAKLLMEESIRLGDEILTYLAKTETEKKIVVLYKDYLLMKKLLGLELIAPEYDTLQKREEVLKPSVLLKRVVGIASPVPLGVAYPPATEQENVYPKHSLAMKQSLLSRGELDALFARAIQFYRGAREREFMMMQNIMARMKQTGKQKAVLITGGFHSQGLTHEFRKNHFSYIEVTPRISEIGDDQVYKKSMMLELPFPRLAGQAPISSTILRPRITSTMSYLSKTDVQYVAEILAFLLRQEMITFPSGRGQSEGWVRESIQTWRTQVTSAKSESRMSETRQLPGAGDDDPPGPWGPEEEAVEIVEFPNLLAAVLWRLGISEEEFSQPLIFQRLQDDEETRNQFIEIQDKIKELRDMQIAARAFYWDFPTDQPSETPGMDGVSAQTVASFFDQFLEFLQIQIVSGQNDPMAYFGDPLAAGGLGFTGMVEQASLMFPGERFQSFSQYMMEQAEWLQNLFPGPQDDPQQAVAPSMESVIERMLALEPLLILMQTFRIAENRQSNTDDPIYQQARNVLALFEQEFTPKVRDQNLQLIRIQFLKLTEAIQFTEADRLEELDIFSEGTQTVLSGILVSGYDWNHEQDMSDEDWHRALFTFVNLARRYSHQAQLRYELYEHTTGDMTLQPLPSALFLEQIFEEIRTAQEASTLLDMSPVLDYTWALRAHDLFYAESMNRSVASNLRRVDQLLGYVPTPLNNTASQSESRTEKIETLKKRIRTGLEKAGIATHGLGLTRRSKLKKFTYEERLPDPSYPEDDSERTRVAAELKRIAVVQGVSSQSVYDELGLHVDELDGAGESEGNRRISWEKYLTPEKRFLAQIDYRLRPVNVPQEYAQVAADLRKMIEVVISQENPAPSDIEMIYRTYRKIPLHSFPKSIEFQSTSIRVGDATDGYTVKGLRFDENGPSLSLMTVGKRESVQSYGILNLEQGVRYQTADSLDLHFRLIYDLSKDGRMAAYTNSSSNDSIWLLHFDTGKTSRKKLPNSLRSGIIRQLAFLNDGKRLGAIVHVENKPQWVTWNLEESEEISVEEVPILWVAETGLRFSMSDRYFISPSGTTFAFQSEDENVWFFKRRGDQFELEGRPLFKIPTNDRDQRPHPYSLVYSPDGTHLALAVQDPSVQRLDRLWVWGILGGTPQESIRNQPVHGKVLDIQFMPNNEWLLISARTPGFERQRGREEEKIYLHSLKSANTVPLFYSEDRMDQIALSRPLTIDPQSNRFGVAHSILVPELRKENEIVTPSRATVSIGSIEYASESQFTVDTTAPVVATLEGIEHLVQSAEELQQLEESSDAKSEAGGREKNIYEHLMTWAQRGTYLSFFALFLFVALKINTLWLLIPFAVSSIVGGVASSLNRRQLRAEGEYLKRQSDFLDRFGELHKGLRPLADALSRSQADSLDEAAELYTTMQFFVHFKESFQMLFDIDVPLEAHEIGAYLGIARERIANIPDMLSVIEQIREGLQNGTLEEDEAYFNEDTLSDLEAFFEGFEAQVAAVEKRLKKARGEARTLTEAQQLAYLDRIRNYMPVAVGSAGEVGGWTRNQLLAEGDAALAESVLGVLQQLQDGVNEQSPENVDAYLDKSLELRQALLQTQGREAIEAWLGSVREFLSGPVEGGRDEVGEDGTAPRVLRTFQTLKEALQVGLQAAELPIVDLGLGDETLTEYTYQKRMLKQGYPEKAEERAKVMAELKRTTVVSGVSSSGVYDELGLHLDELDEAGESFQSEETELNNRMAWELYFTPEKRLLGEIDFRLRPVNVPAEYAQVAADLREMIEVVIRQESPAPEVVEMIYRIYRIIPLHSFPQSIGLDLESSIPVTDSKENYVVLKLRFHKGTSSLSLRAYRESTESFGTLDLLGGGFYNNDLSTSFVYSHFISNLSDDGRFAVRKIEVDGGMGDFPGVIDVINFDNGQITSKRLPGHLKYWDIWALSFLNDRKRVAAVIHDRGQLKFVTWDLEESEEDRIEEVPVLWNKEDSFRLTSRSRFYFSPSGRLFIIQDGEHLQVFRKVGDSFEISEKLSAGVWRNWLGGIDVIPTLVFSQDGTHIAMAAHNGDSESDELWVWEISDGKLEERIRKQPIYGKYYDLKFTRNNEWLLIAAKSTESDIAGGEDENKLYLHSLRGRDPVSVSYAQDNSLDDASRPFALDSESTRFGISHQTSGLIPVADGGEERDRTSIIRLGTIQYVSESAFEHRSEARTLTDAQQKAYLSRIRSYMPVAVGSAGEVGGWTRNQLLAEGDAALAESVLGVLQQLQDGVKEQSPENVDAYLDKSLELRQALLQTQGREAIEAWLGSVREFLSGPVEGGEDEDQAETGPRVLRTLEALKEALRSGLEEAGLPTEGLGLKGSLLRKFTYQQRIQAEPFPETDAKLAEAIAELRRTTSVSGVSSPIVHEVLGYQMNELEEGTSQDNVKMAWGYLTPELRLLGEIDFRLRPVNVPEAYKKVAADLREMIEVVIREENPSPAEVEMIYRIYRIIPLYSFPQEMEWISRDIRVEDAEKNPQRVEAFRFHEEQRSWSMASFKGDASPELFGTLDRDAPHNYRSLSSRDYMRNGPPTLSEDGKFAADYFRYRSKGVQVPTTLLIFNYDNGKVTYKQIPDPFKYGHIQRVAFLKDRKRVAAIIYAGFEYKYLTWSLEESEEGVLEEWDVLSPGSWNGEPFELSHRITLSPSGTAFVGESEEGRVGFFRKQGDHFVLEEILLSKLPKSNFSRNALVSYSVVFSPDGSHMALAVEDPDSEPDYYRVWEISDGKPKIKFEKRFIYGKFLDLRFTPNNEWLLISAETPEFEKKLGHGNGTHKVYLHSLNHANRLALFYGQTRIDRSAQERPLAIDSGAEEFGVAQRINSWPENGRGSESMFSSSVIHHGRIRYTSESEFDVSSGEASVLIAGTTTYLVHSPEEMNAILSRSESRQGFGPKAVLEPLGFKGRSEARIGVGKLQFDYDSVQDSERIMGVYSDPSDDSHDEGSKAPVYRFLTSEGAEEMAQRLPPWIAKVSPEEFVFNEDAYSDDAPVSASTNFFEEGDNEEYARTVYQEAMANIEEWVSDPPTLVLHQEQKQGHADSWISAMLGENTHTMQIEDGEKWSEQKTVLALRTNENEIHLSAAFFNEHLRSPLKRFFLEQLILMVSMPDVPSQKKALLEHTKKVLLTQPGFSLDGISAFLDPEKTEPEPLILYLALWLYFINWVNADSTDSVVDAISQILSPLGTLKGNVRISNWLEFLDNLHHIFPAPVASRIQHYLRTSTFLPEGAEDKEAHFDEALRNLVTFLMFLPEKAIDDPALRPGVHEVAAFIRDRKRDFNGHFSDLFTQVTETVEDEKPGKEKSELKAPLVLIDLMRAEFESEDKRLAFDRNPIWEVAAEEIPDNSVLILPFAWLHFGESERARREMHTYQDVAAEINAYITGEKSRLSKKKLFPKEEETTMGSPGFRFYKQAVEKVIRKIRKRNLEKGAGIIFYPDFDTQMDVPEGEDNDYLRVLFERYSRDLKDLAGNRPIAWFHLKAMLLAEQDQAVWKPTRDDEHLLFSTTRKFFGKTHQASVFALHTVVKASREPTNLFEEAMALAGQHEKPFALDGAEFPTDLSIAALLGNGLGTTEGFDQYHTGGIFVMPIPNKKRRKEKAKTERPSPGADKDIDSEIGPQELPVPEPQLETSGRAEARSKEGLPDLDEEAVRTVLLGLVQAKDGDSLKKAFEDPDRDRGKQAKLDAVFLEIYKAMLRSLQSHYRLWKGRKRDTDFLKEQDSLARALNSEENGYFAKERDKHVNISFNAFVQTVFKLLKAKPENLKSLTKGLALLPAYIDRREESKPLPFFKDEKFKSAGLTRGEDFMFQMLIHLNNGISSDIVKRVFYVLFYVFVGSWFSISAYLSYLGHLGWFSWVIAAIVGVLGIIFVEAIKDAFKVATKDVAKNLFDVTADTKKAKAQRKRHDFIKGIKAKDKRTLKAEYDGKVQNIRDTLKDRKGSTRQGLLGFDAAAQMVFEIYGTELWIPEERDHAMPRAIRTLEKAERMLEAQPNAPPQAVALLFFKEIADTHENAPALLTKLYSKMDRRWRRLLSLFTSPLSNQWREDVKRFIQIAFALDRRKYREAYIKDIVAQEMAIDGGERNGIPIDEKLFYERVEKTLTTTDKLAYDRAHQEDVLSILKGEKKPEVSKRVSPGERGFRFLSAPFRAFSRKKASTEEQESGASFHKKLGSLVMTIWTFFGNLLAFLWGIPTFDKEEKEVLTLTDTEKEWLLRSQLGVHLYNGESLVQHGPEDDADPVRKLSIVEGWARYLEDTPSFCVSSCTGLGAQARGTVHKITTNGGARSAFRAIPVRPEDVTQNQQVVITGGNSKGEAPVVLTSNMHQQKNRALHHAGLPQPTGIFLRLSDASNKSEIQGPIFQALFYDAATQVIQINGRRVTWQQRYRELLHELKAAEESEAQRAEEEKDRKQKEEKTGANGKGAGESASEISLTGTQSTLGPQARIDRSVEEVQADIDAFTAEANRNGFDVGVLIPWLVTRKLHVVVPTQAEKDSIVEILKDILMGRDKEHYKKELKSAGYSEAAAERIAKDLQSRTLLHRPGSLFEGLSSEEKKGETQIADALNQVLPIHVLPDEEGEVVLHQGYRRDPLLKTRAKSVNTVLVQRRGNEIWLHEAGRLIVLQDTRQIREQAKPLTHQWGTRDMDRVNTAYQNTKRNGFQVMSFGNSDMSAQGDRDEYLAKRQDYSNFGIFHNGQVILTEGSAQTLESMRQLHKDYQNTNGRYGVPESAIAGFYVSHAHIDRLSGIEMLVYEKIDGKGRDKKIRVLASHLVQKSILRLLANRVKSKLGIATTEAAIEHLKPMFDFVELDVDSETGHEKGELAGLQFTLSPTLGHFGIPTYGFDAFSPSLGTSVGYVADSRGLNDSMRRFYGKSNVLIVSQLDPKVGSFGITNEEVVNSFPDQVANGTVYTTHSPERQTNRSLQRFHVFKSVPVQTKRQREAQINQIKDNLEKVIPHSPALQRYNSLEFIEALARRGQWVRGSTVRYEEGTSLFDYPYATIVITGKYQVKIGGEVVAELGPGDLIGESAGKVRGFSEAELDSVIQVTKADKDESDKEAAREDLQAFFDFLQTAKRYDDTGREKHFHFRKKIKGVNYYLWGRDFKMEALDDWLRDSELLKKRPELRNPSRRKDLLNALEILHRNDAHMLRTATVTLAPGEDPDTTRVVRIHFEDLLQIENAAAGGDYSYETLQARANDDGRSESRAKQESYLKPLKTKGYDALSERITKNLNLSNASKMSPRQRADMETAHKVFIQGFSAFEVAEQENRTLSTIQHRLSHVSIALRKKLWRKGEDKEKKRRMKDFRIESRFIRLYGAWYEAYSDWVANKEGKKSLASIDFDYSGREDDQSTLMTLLFERLGIPDGLLGLNIQKGKIRPKWHEVFGYTLQILDEHGKLKHQFLIADKQGNFLKKPSLELKDAPGQGWQGKAFHLALLMEGAYLGRVKPDLKKALAPRKIIRLDERGRKKAYSKIDLMPRNLSFMGSSVSIPRAYKGKYARLRMKKYDVHSQTKELFFLTDYQPSKVVLQARVIQHRPNGFVFESDYGKTYRKAKATSSKLAYDARLYLAGKTVKRRKGELPKRVTPPPLEPKKIEGDRVFFGLSKGGGIHVPGHKPSMILVPIFYVDADRVEKLGFWFDVELEGDMRPEEPVVKLWVNAQGDWQSSTHPRSDDGRSESRTVEEAIVGMIEAYRLSNKHYGFHEEVLQGAQRQIKEKVGDSVYVEALVKILSEIDWVKKRGLDLKQINFLRLSAHMELNRLVNEGVELEGEAKKYADLSWYPRLESLDGMVTINFNQSKYFGETNADSALRRIKYQLPSDIEIDFEKMIGLRNAGLIVFLDKAGMRSVPVLKLFGIPIGSRKTTKVIIVVEDRQYEGRILLSRVTQFLKDYAKVEQALEQNSKDSEQIKKDFEQNLKAFALELDPARTEARTEKSSAQREEEDRSSPSGTEARRVQASDDASFLGSGQIGKQRLTGLRSLSLRQMLFPFHFSLEGQINHPAINDIIKILTQRNWAIKLNPSVKKLLAKATPNVRLNEFMRVLEMSFRLGGASIFIIVGHDFARSEGRSQGFNEIEEYAPRSESRFDFMNSDMVEGLFQFAQNQMPFYETQLGDLLELGALENRLRDRVGALQENLELLIPGFQLDDWINAENSQRLRNLWRIMNLVELYQGVGENAPESVNAALTQLQESRLTEKLLESSSDDQFEGFLQGILSFQYLDESGIHLDKMPEGTRSHELTQYIIARSYEGDQFALILRGLRSQFALLFLYAIREGIVSGYPAMDGTDKDETGSQVSSLLNGKIRTAFRHFLDDVQAQGREDVGEALREAALWNEARSTRDFSDLVTKLGFLDSHVDEVAKLDYTVYWTYTRDHVARIKEEMNVFGRNPSKPDPNGSRPQWFYNRDYERDLQAAEAFVEAFRAAVEADDLEAMVRAFSEFDQTANPYYYGPDQVQSPIHSIRSFLRRIHEQNLLEDVETNRNPILFHILYMLHYLNESLIPAGYFIRVDFDTSDEDRIGVLNVTAGPIVAYRFIELPNGEETVQVFVDAYSPISGAGSRNDANQKIPVQITRVRGNQIVGVENLQSTYQTMFLPVFLQNVAFDAQVIGVKPLRQVRVVADHEVNHALVSGHPVIGVNAQTEDMPEVLTRLEGLLTRFAEKELAEIRENSRLGRILVDEMSAMLQEAATDHEVNRKIRKKRKGKHPSYDAAQKILRGLFKKRGGKKSMSQEEKAEIYRTIYKEDIFGFDMPPIISDTAVLLRNGTSFKDALQRVFDRTPTGRPDSEGRSESRARVFVPIQFNEKAQGGIEGLKQSLRIQLEALAQALEAIEGDNGAAHKAQDIRSFLRALDYMKDGDGILKGAYELIADQSRDEWEHSNVARTEARADESDEPSFWTEMIRLNPAVGSALGEVQKVLSQYNAAEDFNQGFDSSFAIHDRQKNIHPLDIGYADEEKVKPLTPEELKLVKHRLSAILKKAREIGDEDMVEFLEDFIGSSFSSAGRRIFKADLQSAGLAEVNRRVLLHENLFHQDLLAKVDSLDDLDEETQERLYVFDMTLIHELHHMVDFWDQGGIAASRIEIETILYDSELDRDQREDLKERSAIIRTAAYFDGYVKTNGNRFVAIYHFPKINKAVAYTTAQSVLAVEEADWERLPPQVESVAKYSRYHELAYRGYLQRSEGRNAVYVISEVAGGVIAYAYYEDHEVAVAMIKEIAPDELPLTSESLRQIQEALEIDLKAYLALAKAKVPQAPYVLAMPIHEITPELVAELGGKQSKAELVVLNTGEVNADRAVEERHWKFLKKNFPEGQVYKAGDDASDVLAELEQRIPGLRKLAAYSKESSLELGDAFDLQLIYDHAEVAKAGFRSSLLRVQSVRLIQALAASTTDEETNALLQFFDIARSEGRKVTLGLSFYQHLAALSTEHQAELLALAAA